MKLAIDFVVIISIIVQQIPMSIALNPYLIFNGHAAEAMKFYQSILGGELSMQTFGEAKASKEPADKDRTIHADLRSGAMILMASDSPASDKDHQAVFGNNVQLSISGTDAKKLTEFFRKLSAGGSVDMPLEKQFWGDTFGMLKDKFGVHWMVNISAKK